MKLSKSSLFFFFFKLPKTQFESANKIHPVELTFQHQRAQDMSISWKCKWSAMVRQEEIWGVERSDKATQNGNEKWYKTVFLGDR